MLRATSRRLFAGGRPATSTSSSPSTSAVRGLNTLLRAHPHVAQRLHNALGIKGRPTPIQKLAIPALLGEGEEAASGSLPDVAIQSPTGTGKSLAFLLPGVCGVDVRLARTQMMVVVPTRELAFQVHDLLRQIVPTKPNKKGNAFHLSRLTGVVRHRHLTDLRVFPPHVVVGTPQTLAHAIEEGAISKSHLRYIVFDEVDHLTSPFTASILPDLTSPGRVVYGEDRLRQGKSPRRAAPREGRGQRQGSTRETPRLVFVSATMPEGLLEGALPWQQEQGREKPVHFHIPGGVPAGPRHEVLSLPTAEADARTRAARPWGGSGAAPEAAAGEAAGEEAGEEACEGRAVDGSKARIGGGSVETHSTWHTLLRLDAIGESMLVSGDATGCVCVWDAGRCLDTDPSSPTAGEGGSGSAMELPLVAALPPPDVEASSEDSACAIRACIRGLTITQTDGLAVAGGGIVYAMGQGELTKFVPVGASSLAMLSDAGAREGLFQDNLLSGLHAGLGMGNDEDNDTGQLV